MHCVVTAVSQLLCSFVSDSAVAVAAEPATPLMVSGTIAAVSRCAGGLMLPVLTPAPGWGLQVAVLAVLSGLEMSRDTAHDDPDVLAPPPTGLRILFCYS